MTVSPSYASSQAQRISDSDDDDGNVAGIGNDDDDDDGDDIGNDHDDGGHLVFFCIFFQGKWCNGADCRMALVARYS